MWLINTKAIQPLRWDSVSRKLQPNPGPTTSMTSAAAPLLRRGDRNADVQRLQQQLNATFVPPHYPRLVPLVIDGYFGPITERRVLLAQLRYLLWQDGVVTRELWRSLQQDAALIQEMPELQLYTMGPAVGAVQQLLTLVGFYQGRVNQCFGPQLQTAIQDFQARQPPPLSSVIRANGIIDRHTWGALEELAIFQIFD